MADSPKLNLKQLEERRKELVAQSDGLRAALAARCEEMSAAPLWASQGLELARRMVSNHAILSTALNFFRRSRS